MIFCIFRNRHLALPAIVKFEAQNNLMRIFFAIGWWDDATSVALCSVSPHIVLLNAFAISLHTNLSGNEVVNPF